jgi:hypothetical protein
MESSKRIHGSRYAKDSTNKQDQYIQRADNEYVEYMAQASLTLLGALVREHPRIITTLLGYLPDMEQLHDEQVYARRNPPP